METITGSKERRQPRSPRHRYEGLLIRIENDATAPDRMHNPHDGATPCQCGGGRSEDRNQSRGTDSRPAPAGAERLAHRLPLSQAVPKETEASDHAGDRGGGSVSGGAGEEPVPPVRGGTDPSRFHSTGRRDA